MLNFISLHLLAAIWGLAVLIPGAAYVDVVTSRKVILSSNIPFTSLKSFIECLEEKRCRLITHDPTTAAYQQVTNPGGSLSARIAKAITENPIVIAPLEKIPGMILKEKSYYLVWPWTKENLLYNIRHEVPLFYIANAGFTIPYTFPLRKNSSLFRPLNRLGLQLRETRFAEELRHRYDKFLISAVNSARISSGNKEGLPAFTTFFALYGCGVDWPWQALRLSL